jgi:hypothetical protein
MLPELPLTKDLPLLTYFETKYVPHQVNLSPHATEQYRISIRLLNKFHSSPVKIADLEPSLIARFMKWLKGLGRTERTVNNKRQAFITLWKHAATINQLIDAPPRIPKLEEPKRLPQAWDVDQVKRIVESARHSPVIRDWTPAHWEALVLVIYIPSHRGNPAGDARLSRPRGWYDPAVGDVDETETGNPAPTAPRHTRGLAETSAFEIRPTVPLAAADAGNLAGVPCDSVGSGIARRPEGSVSQVAAHFLHLRLRTSGRTCCQRAGRACDQYDCVLSRSSLASQAAEATQCDRCSTAAEISGPRSGTAGECVLPDRPWFRSPARAGERRFLGSVSREAAWAVGVSLPSFLWQPSAVGGAA